MRKKGIIVSGYFNPLHRGHIEYFVNAKKFADELIVIVNNDKQREQKDSKEFMLEDERLLIIENLKIVNKAYLSIDNDRSVIKTINMIYDELKDDFDLSFGNGGDQKNNIIPEKEICERL